MKLLTFEDCWDSTILRLESNGFARLPISVPPPAALLRARAIVQNEGTMHLKLWSRFCSLTHTKTLSVERQLEYLALFPAGLTVHCSAQLDMLDLFTGADEYASSLKIARLSYFNNQQMEETLPDEELLKLSQWLQEDELISLLKRGRLDSTAKASDSFEEPTISGRLLDFDVSAFPDTGAATNFISLPYARQRGLRIDENVRKRVKVGDGSTIRVVGTTTLPFTFAGEPEKHNLTFHVLRKSVHDVVLGSTFLRASETFTRFAHRVGRRIREAVGNGIHRVHFLGSQQYVNGVANGVHVDAVPDTGADVSVMSAKFAKANGFDTDEDEQHRILLGFADGSTAKARGVVKDMAWKFGADEQTHLTDVYVLPSLPVDLVLGYGFLCRTDAFLGHKQDFWHVDDPDRRNVRLRLCIIRRLKRQRGGDGVGHSSNTEEERWQLAKPGEIDLYRKAKDEAQALGLSEDETTQYLQPHIRRWQQFLATRPAHSTDVVSMSPSSPSSGSAASSQTGGAQVQVQSHTLPTDGTLSAGRFNMNWFRRKARGKKSDAAVAVQV